MSASANAVWQVSAVSSGSPNFIDKGYMEKASYTGGSAAVYTNDNATDFASPKDFFSEIYVRATFQTGTGNPPDASSGMDTWLYVYNGTNFANRFWRWTAGPGFDTSSGTILLELCTVGNGTNIVA
ncbi:MAG: hypothetical protein QNJ81_02315, partial [Acidimicrobiia bacterium]|nr:hypothetical protein [Acidimicrobiia bacterium]